MTISVKTQKMLWGRAANRCSVCRIELVIDPSETDDEALVGDACHIVADSEGGPRGVSPLTRLERDKYSNLLLLCKVHHKMVDDQPSTYTIEKLKEIKAFHEQWVRESLQEFDNEKQKDDERYASIIEEWIQRVELNSWEGWTYGLLNAGQPSLGRKLFVQLRELNAWILVRVWPQRYSQLEDAFENFRCVLNDLLVVFERHIDNEQSDKSGVLWTQKFYRNGYGNLELERQLAKTYSFHVDFVQDLTLELTRAANYVCDKVRRFIFPAFRLQEGVLLVMRESGLSNYRYRVEYKKEERIAKPYPGLENFKKIRTTRDFYVGEVMAYDNND